jgi:hypothetical protein
MSDACANKSYEQMRNDYQVMKNAITGYKSLGGVLPAGLARTVFALDQAFVTGDNVDAAFKSTCLEMGNFLATNEEYCARHAGFASKADMAQTGGVRWQDVDNYDICMARHYYQSTQAEAVKKVLNIGDPKSFVSVFTAGTKKQIWDLLTKWLGDKFKETFKKKPAASSP